MSAKFVIFFLPIHLGGKAGRIFVKILSYRRVIAILSLSLSLSPITNYFPRCWEKEREREEKKKYRWHFACEISFVVDKIGGREKKEIGRWHNRCMETDWKREQKRELDGPTPQLSPPPPRSALVFEKRRSVKASSWNARTWNDSWILRSRTKSSENVVDRCWSERACKWNGRRFEPPSPLSG